MTTPLTHPLNDAGSRRYDLLLQEGLGVLVKIIWIFRNDESYTIKNNVICIFVDKKLAFDLTKKTDIVTVLAIKRFHTSNEGFRMTFFFNSPNPDW